MRFLRWLLRMGREKEVLTMMARGGGWDEGFGLGSGKSCAC